MPFQPDNYEIVVPVSFVKNAKGEVTPTFRDATATVFWTSHAAPAMLEVTRAEVLEEHESAYTKPWKLSSVELVKDWGIRCSRTVTNVYKLDLNFIGQVLDDVNECDRAGARNLIHGILRAACVRLDVKTDCGARYSLFVRLKYEAC